MGSRTTRLQVNVDIQPPGESLRWDVDAGVWTQDAFEGLKVSGWALHERRPIVGVNLYSGNQFVGGSKVDRDRPWVQRMHAHWANAGQAGFNLEVPGVGPGHYRLEVEHADGRCQVMATMHLRERSSRRVLFMHIPKTAGSSVNSWLTSHFGRKRYEVHVENQAGWQLNASRIRNLELISGHHSMSTFKRSLDQPGYYTITVVREAFGQLASHLTWIRRLSEPGEDKRLRQHPDYIQKLSKFLAEVDFSKPRELENMANWLQGSMRQLVSNCQLRYFVELSPDEQVGEQHVELGLSMSERFDRIGRTEMIDDFTVAVAGDLGWSEPAPLERSNKTNNNYGLDVNCERVRRALEPLVRYDLMFLDALNAPANKRMAK